MDRFGHVLLPGPNGTTGPGGAPPPIEVPGTEETRRLAFSGREGAVQAGLELTREALRSWSWLPTADEERLAVAEDLLLMVAELVANACLHTSGGPGELRLRWDGRRLRAEVTDTSPVPPELRPHADPGRPGRHGLRVVDRLARSWGCTPEGGGKLVWLEVALPPGPPNRRERRI
ncbi:ATP-binding protein [Kitasatospora sp. MY 5-36]|uniref:ATP-binding protein n=1 Tax=Kitasatospora sp. MY 5-36 TaxID=1678027 RepID=UPI0007C64BC9|nr:ATP-binding protein [Kitasatospora sp. MY 5-36]